MWGAIDVNDNGYASLSEITRVSEWMPFVVEEIPKNTDILALKIYSNVLAKQPGYLNSGNLFDICFDEQGVRDVIDSDDLFDSRPAINRAFHHCRKLAKVLSISSSLPSLLSSWMQILATFFPLPNI